MSPSSNSGAGDTGARSPKSPHIVLITTSYPDAAFQPGQESAGAFVHDFALALAERCQVTVVAPSLQAAIARETGLTVHRFSAPSLPLSLLRPGHPAEWPAIFATLRAGQAAVDDVCTQSAVDHLLALWALPAGQWARSAGKRIGAPYSIWALGSDIWSLGRLPLVRRWLRTVLTDATLRFADGYRLCDDVNAIAGKSCDFLPSSRALPPIAPKTLRAAPPYRLAFLGRWHTNKGVDLLLDALHSLPAEDWTRIEEVRLAGGGPLEATVQAGCARLETAGRAISMLGFLGRDEAAALLAWADVLLIPSRIESIPVVFSDAMQALCPVVAMPVGDLPRLVTDYGVGVLADSVDAGAFSSALSQMLRHALPDFQAGLQAAAGAFDVAKTADRFFQAAGLV